jgi:glutamyl-tRNA reductase
MDGRLFVGLSHETAPVEVRETVCVPERLLADADGRARAAGDLEESVVLSTCNRTEVYGVHRGNGAAGEAAAGRARPALFVTLCSRKP